MGRVHKGQRQLPAPRDPSGTPYTGGVSLTLKAGPVVEWMPRKYRLEKGEVGRLGGKGKGYL